MEKRTLMKKKDIMAQKPEDMVFKNKYRDKFEGFGGWINRRRLRGYRPNDTSSELTLKMETIAFPKRRDNSPSPGDILKDVVETH
jgi:hypothetical protein